ncbi:MAG TPA: class I SAM-dependent methyltransferase [Caulobacteraceae bacterium]|jgi:SAM-dependent methyltransferase|nr:class I SAM-dependent methyltransferase [Caulobacteraceae bacterium]
MAGAQNIYDRSDFFEAYARLRRSIEGLAGMPEWPTLEALLPPLAGARVVDLGCGYGWFSAHAADSGAASVLALDVSERMLERARELNARATVTYRRADLETEAFPAEAFDLAFSALTLHYVADLPRLLNEIARALIPGGVLVASLEHPILTAPRHPGWSEAPHGGKVWPVDGYFHEGRREIEWLAKGVVKHHRTLESLLTGLAEAGLGLERLVEFRPSLELLAERPELAVELERPMFLLIRARTTPVEGRQG